LNEIARFPRKHLFAHACLIFALAVLIIPAFASPARAAAPEFTDDMARESDSGQVQAAWEADGPVALTMTPLETGDLRLVYRGEAKGIFLSGLADGDYELRLAGQDGALSQPVVVSVEHQSLSRALWLVALGAIASLGVVIVIVRGARDD